MADRRNLTANEIVDRINSLSEHQYLKIADTRLAWAIGLRDCSPNDLFQEALTRLLEGGRHLPENEDFAHGVLTIMRSIASQKRVQQSNYWLDVEDDELDLASNEDIVKDMIQEEILKDIQERVGNDNTAADVMRLRAQEYGPEEICQKLGIRPTTYDSAIKRIRRAVRKYRAEQSVE